MLHDENGLEAEANHCEKNLDESETDCGSTTNGMNGKGFSSDKLYTKNSNASALDNKEESKNSMISAASLKMHETNPFEANKSLTKIPSMTLTSPGLSSKGKKKKGKWY